MEQCLNCGGALQGPFCSACGQRAVPPNPTTSELVGDAWHELTGYDGRIAATARGLFHPGRLTRDYLEGRRLHYLPPLRVYLTASVLYFVVAASTPMLERTGSDLSLPGIRIGMSRSSDAEPTPEQRQQGLGNIDEAPWLFRPMLRAAAADPEGFRARIFTTMPRVFFGMLPVFAAIVALFYRGRTGPTYLVFAAHLHAFLFLAMTLSELVKFSGSLVAAASAGVLISAGLAVYIVRAFRAVYGGRWLAVVAKTLAIGVVYLLTAIPAFIVILVWAAR